MATNPDRTPPQGPLTQGGGQLVLAVGAAVGLLLLCLGVYYAFQWSGTFTGGLEQWHKNWWHIIVCGLLVFGGLAVMFGALQVARGEERTNPSLRRLIYGYNAVLSCLLVAVILVVINVFAGALPIWPFTYAQETYDWSGSERFNLEPKSVEVLKTLDKPVKVYVLLPSGSGRAQYILREVRTLLEKCREVDRNITVEELSPDLSPAAVDQLVKNYQIPERQGMLVVYGTAPDESYEFIPVNDFAPQIAGGNPMGGGGDKERIEFKGEASLIHTLGFLSQGKTKPVIYFTQGNGELELNNMDTARDDRGIGVLRDRLTRANFEVKELRLGVGTDKIPADTESIVVIARPSRPFPESALNALRAYLKPADPKAKKGKLIVLFDVVPDEQGQMVHTGLEDLLLKDAGVQVDDDRVVTANMYKDPLIAPVVVNPDLSNAALASALSRFENALIPMFDVRTVHQAERNPGAPPPADYQVEPLLLADPQRLIWKETNLNVNVQAQVEELRKREHLDELSKRISREPLPVAVAVSSLGAPDPNDPHAFMNRGNRKQEARMLVFGDATWVSNRMMNQQVRFFDLFSGCVSWLRGRPMVGDSSEGTKERKAYTISPANPGEFAAQVLYLPLTLLAVGILGLGAGVWVVRRR